MSAAARFEALRTRDALASSADDEDEPGFVDDEAPPLIREEALELLALGEALARKAAYGRPHSVRSARRAGASWSQIGAALGTSKQAAWEAHNRWIDEQAKQDREAGRWGLDDEEIDAARTLAGEPDN